MIQTRVRFRACRRLKELGVQQKSVWAWYENTDRDDTPRFNRFDEHCTVCMLAKQAWQEKYVAFTVAELGEMLPDQVSSWRTGIEWMCSHDELSVTGEAVPEQRANNEADARAKMVMYLVENKLVAL